jgi:beta-mannosidase
MDPALSPTRARVDGHVRLQLDHGWEAAATLPGDRPGPDGLDDLDWRPASVPGTAAGVLRAAGVEAGPLDAQDWWFRTTFEVAPADLDEEVVLCFGGIATLAEVYLNGELLLRGESMFATHVVAIAPGLLGPNELAICCRSMTGPLAAHRRPRARWRTRLVPDNGLRWFRTTLLGRIPSFSPGPVAVGPWRPVWLERRRRIAIDDLVLRPRLDGDDGVLSVRTRLRALGGRSIDGVDLELDGPSGHHTVSLGLTQDDAGSTVEGELRIRNVARWWPHTHGEPVLHEVRLVIRSGDVATTVHAGRVGFRTLSPGPTAQHDIDRDGLFVHVNGVPIFARGALWTPLDIVGLAPSADELREAIETVRAAGMNMLRVPGFGAYEQDMFHDLCDELGVLVWQDLMFASMDYPFTDDGFRCTAEAEVRDVVEWLAGRPSTTVLCGNSEVEQQVAMLGLDLSLARIPFFDTVVPEIASVAGLDAIYVPSAPFGGDLPMRPDRGVTNYYGVGGYRGPLSDARTSGLRFAAECLAFANVPDEEALATLVPEPPGEAFVHHPRWKAGVARDAGSGWDFDDLRDHYLQVVYGVDPGTLRRADHDRYLELSRAVTGEVMAHVFGEWRRAGSPSGGGLILWLRDLVTGAGYGVVDHHGRPKTAYHHLRRILAPTAVWLINEGTGGVVAHVANDGPSPLSARLRVALYTDLEQPVGGGEALLELPAHGSAQLDLERVIGHFVDASWAYRFGPPAQDAIVASLERDGDPDPVMLSQAFLFPAGWPLSAEPERRLGLSATARVQGDKTVQLIVESRRLAYGVRIHVAGYRSTDDAFSVEPGGARRIDLHPVSRDVTYAGGQLTALNLAGHVAIRQADRAS